jgi:hypothetical protein
VTALGERCTPGANYIAEEIGMKRALFGLLLAASLVLGTGTIAGAITDGQLDGDGHPNVGLMVAQGPDGNDPNDLPDPLWRCSGTLVSPTIFLTAGHCTESPAIHAEIWFRTDVQNPPGNAGYPQTGDVGGTPHPHPQYDPNAFFLHDLGVVVLEEPVTVDEYAALPELNQLNQFKTRRGQDKVTFTAVGYGLQKSFPTTASWKNVALRIRMVAHPKLIQINNGYVGDFSILLSNNTHTGGTCFGDSGGPNFIGDSNVIAGVTSFGKNGNCAGTGGVYRVDKADDLDWLATFGVTP